MRYQLKEANLIIGLWSLESFYRENAKGEVHYPLGKDAVGLIRYSTDGYLSMFVRAKNRVGFKSKSLFEATLEERAEAARTYQSYFGWYKLSYTPDHRVKYDFKVEGDLLPIRDGNSIVRYIEHLDEMKLKFHAPPLNLNGVDWIAHALWNRVQSPFNL